MVELEQLAKIGNYKKLDQEAITSLERYVDSIDITDAGAKDLNSLGKTLVRILKRSREARLNQDSWAELGSRMFLLAYDIMEQLNSMVDETTFTEKASSMAWLRELSILAEEETLVDEDSSPEFTIDAKELRELMES